MTVTWKFGAIVALGLVALGWFAHGLANGPPPDVAKTLAEAEAVAGEKAQAREAAIRAGHSAQLATDSARDDSTNRANAARARALRAKADTATMRTDAALALLARQGVETTELAGALARERAATERRRLADSTTAADSLASVKRRALLVLTERDRLYGRVDSLTSVAVDLRDDLKKATRKGLDPAVTLVYGASCNHLIVAGTVRVIGAIRGGVGIETACRR